MTAIYEIVPVGGRTFDDPLRYQGEGAGRRRATARELAFLRIRYKLPGQPISRLIERPITDADVVPDLARRKRHAGRPRSPPTASCSAAIPTSPRAMTGTSILALASGARGDDPYGLRAQFVQFVRAAPAAKSLNE